VKHFKAWKTSESPGPKSFRRWSVIALTLALVASFLLPAWASRTPAYDSLRLYTEALFEITQKYVWPKNENDLIYGSLRGMMNSLDPDSSFLTPKEYQNYLHGKKTASAQAGLDLIMKDNLLTVVSVIDGSPAAQAGLKPGDHILKIGGHLVRNLTTQEALRRFRGAPGTVIKLQVLRNSRVKPLDLTVTLAPLGLKTVTSRYLDNDLAYIRIRYFNNDTPVELDKVLKSINRHQPPIKGIILDLRNNARGTLEQAVRSTSLLLGDQTIVLAKGRSPKTEESFKGKDRDLVLKPLPRIVVLMDKGTARAAEIVAGALKDQAQATLLGVKTLGLCGITKAFPLDDGSALMMTVAQCYTPKGQKIQGKGLEPEVEGKTPKLAATSTTEPPRTLSPDQDPWVRQAMELLISGKPKSVALKEPGS
jgi:carboxyl-terminal processing protease